MAFHNSSNYQLQIINFDNLETTLNVKSWPLSYNLIMKLYSFIDEVPYNSRNIDLPMIRHPRLQTLPLQLANQFNKFV